MNEIILGALLVYGIPGLLAAMFWLLVRTWHRALTARDVMARFRPSRQAVARAEHQLGVS